MQPHVQDGTGAESGTVSESGTVAGPPSGTVVADAYAFPERNGIVLASDWSYAAFREKHLDRYVAMCEEYVATELQQPASTHGIGTGIGAMLSQREDQGDANL